MEKTVAVTGATGSIGKATGFELAKEGCHVILLGRNSEKLEQVRAEIIKETNNHHVETVIIDLSEPESVRKAAAEISSRHNSLNALVNVAAILTKSRMENSEGMEYTFATNHLGPFLLTTELLPLLKAGKPARVVTVSAPSTTKINFDDINGKEKFSAGFLGAFGASKMMNLMFTYALSRRLEGTGVTTSVFHPGLVKSELTKNMPALLYYFFQAISAAPGKAARMLCSLAIDTKYAGSNGTFLKYDGKEIKPAAYSLDKNLQEKLWTLSEKFAGVK